MYCKIKRLSIHLHRQYNEIIYHLYSINSVRNIQKLTWIDKQTEEGRWTQHPKPSEHNNKDEDLYSIVINVAISVSFNIVHVAFTGKIKSIQDFIFH